MSREITEPTEAIDLLTDPVALPGSTELNSDLLDRAVAEINRIYVGKGLEMYLAVGEYVLDTFFAGDTQNFHSRGKGHATFRALAERDDLRLSYSVVYNAVAVVEQRRQLPQDLSDTLPFTHQVKLLSLKSDQEKIELGRRALQEALSSRALAEEVKRLKVREPTAPQVGRPALPAFVKAFGKLRAVRAQLGSEPIGPELFSTYSAEKTRTLLDEIDPWIRELQATAEQLRALLQALPDTSAVVVVPVEGENLE